MERIEEQHLRNIVGIGHEQDPSRNEPRLRYFLATVVLRHYLGNAWTDECVRPDFTKVSRGSLAGRLFLRTDSNDSQDCHRHLARIERLAELLYNLQDVQSIEGRRACIREGSVESTLAELEFAGHFTQRGIQVRFLDRSGVKGSDYDYDAIEGETTVCCEVKCKLESTDLGENTISNTLEAARKQVRTDRPAIIGVNILETWIRDSASRATFESALKPFFRSSGRVVAVVVRWEEMYAFPSHDRLLLYKFRPFLNRGSRHRSEDVLRLIQRLTNPTEWNWTRFSEVVSVCMAGWHEEVEQASGE